MDTIAGMKVTRLGEALGAEVTGIDLSAPLDDATFGHILSAFHDHHVLCFRDQDLSPAAQIAFSKRFGELEDQLNADFVIPGFPKVLILSNDLRDGKPIGVIDAGDYWHSDSSHIPLPSLATILHSIRKPSRGGDTEFANMELAYERLPDPMKKRLAGLRAIHAVSKLRNKRVTVSKQRPGAQDHYERQLAIPEVIHPLVRTHPATGRKALFVSARFTIGIDGMAEAEADEILDFLFEHQVNRDFVYRHKWGARDLVMWDNRSVIHRATGGYKYPDVRTLHRTVVAGDAPF
jgi:taurine dioxygenase